MNNTYSTFDHSEYPNRLVRFGFLSGLFGKKEEKPAEATDTAPAGDAPAAPAACPNCGGEMTEGHTCPVAETPAEPAAEETPTPLEEAPAEGSEPAETTEGGEETPPLA